MNSPYDVLVPWCNLPEHINQTDLQRYADLTTKNINCLRSLTSAELLAWAGQNGRFAAIEAATANENPIVRSLASVAKILVLRDETSLDLNLQNRKDMLVGLVRAGIITQEDSDDLYKMATYQLSQVDIWGIKVDLEHLASARLLSGM